MLDAFDASAPGDLHQVVFRQHLDWRRVRIFFGFYSCVHVADCLSGLLPIQEHSTPFRSKQILMRFKLESRWISRS